MSPLRRLTPVGAGTYPVAARPPYWQVPALRWLDDAVDQSRSSFGTAVMTTSAATAAAAAADAWSVSISDDIFPTALAGQVMRSVVSKNNIHSSMALILGDLNSLWFRYQSSQNYMPTGHTIRKINTNNVRCEVTGLVIIMTTQIVSSSRIFMKFDRTSASQFPVTSFCQSVGGSFMLKLAVFDNSS